MLSLNFNLTKETALKVTLPQMRKNLEQDLREKMDRETDKCKVNSQFNAFKMTKL